MKFLAAVALMMLAGCAAPAAHIATGDTGADSPLMHAMQAPDAGYAKQRR
jgi:hypothetical protein